MSDNNTPFRNLKDRIDARILEERRLFICDAVTQNSAHEIIRKLWYLELTDPKKPILLIINSPGGSVDAGFAIWDQVKMIKSPVITLITGLAASMGSVLSLCASPGKSFATPRSRIMIHQPLLGGVIQGQATDLDIQAKEIIKTRSLLVQIYVDKTREGGKKGKTAEEIEKAIDRDTWMTAEETMQFGLLNGIITSFEQLQ